MQIQHVHFFHFRRRTWMLLGHLCVLLVLVCCFLGTIAGSHTSSVSAQNAASTLAQQPARGAVNPFPQGSCTWWAAQRYYQLTGIYVPWTTQSNAWQWTERAHQFHWKVSTHPSPGAIINLQPWTQGAYGLGHVAVVEQVLENGKVVASNMNWGANPSQVVNVLFAPGNGVTFISF